MAAANPPADSAAAVPPADAAPDPRRWLILAVIALAQLMIVLDATVVNIALPSAQRSLHFTTVDRQWVITAYALAFGSLLLLGGRVSSLAGRKVTFLSGLIGFAAASAVGGAATSFGMLVAARACQGAFGAFMAPSALSLLTTTFSGSKDRGRAFGVFGAIAGAGGAIGLLLGGVLTEYLSWRWCLYVNLFFAAIAATGGAILLGRHPRTGHHRLDIPGAVFVSSGMFCIVFGFSNAATHSWHTPSTWGFLIAGVLLLAIFAWWESRTTEPLLPLRVVLDRNRGGAYLSILIAGSGMFGIFLFITYYLQQTLGFSPVKAGLAFVPMALCVAVFAGIAPRVEARAGAYRSVAFGMMLMVVGLVLFDRLGLHAGYSSLLPGFMLFGAGAGLMNVPLTNAVMQATPAARAGIASALLNASREVAGLLGITVIGAVLRTRQGAALRAGADPVHAFVDGYHTGLIVTILLLAGGVVVSYLTLRPRAAGPVEPTAVEPTAVEPTAVAPVRESVALGELSIVDERAGELMVADEVAS